MNSFRNWILVVLAVLGCAIQAQGPDDQFVRIYNLLLQADQLNDSGQSGQAYERYLEVQKGLRRIQLANPAWQPKVIKFRLGYVADKIAPLAAKYKAGAVAAPPPALVEATAKAASNNEVAQLEGRVRDLAEEVDRLRAEKKVLEAKLREALTPQPAPTGQTQLIQAEDRIRSLNKELDVLKVSLEEEKRKLAVDASDQEAGRKALDEANRKLAAQADALVALNREKEQLTQQLRRGEKPSSSGTSALEKENKTLRRELADKRSSTSKKPTPSEAEASLRRELGSIEARLREQMSQNAVLIAEKRTLQSRVNQLGIDLEESKKTANQKGKTPPEPLKETSVRQPGNAESEGLRRDKSRLEQQVASLSSELAEARKPRPAESRESQRNRVQKLEAERVELREKLARANKEAANQPQSPSRRELEKLRSQLAAAQARVDVYELKKTPFSPEELALFQKPQPTPVIAKRAGRGGKRSIKELPSTAGQLVADAQSAFSARRFDEAESKYQEVLRFDLENVYTLANLALVQMEQGRLDIADGNLTKALEIEPEDAYSLSLLGILRFRQDKLDDALDLLSRSVHIDSKNAETHNYMGVVLSQKGMRGPAEASMRKAIQINPGYSEAHHNLAVIYASQTPPFVELARWHYEKAMAAGHPRNPSLEKYFDKKSAGAD